MIAFKDLPEIKADQLSSLTLNYVIFFPQFFKDWKKISFKDIKDILNEDNRTN